MVVWFLLVLWCIGVVLSTDSFKNWPVFKMDEPRLEQVLEGSDVKLKCAGRAENASAYWHYKPCGYRPRINCMDAVNNEKVGMLIEEWKPLECNRNSLELNNVNIADSGLYRCKEAASSLINVYSTIELEVISYLKEQDQELPQFLNILPRNYTAIIDEQVVFQCKVSSQSLPTIVWLLQGPGPLKYQGMSFAPINGTGKIKLSNDVYLSKIVIQQALPSHIGEYYCLAMNTKGFSNISIFLNVLGSYEDYLDIESPTFSVYFLFFIPVLLASIPLTIWMCFKCLKNTAHSDTERTYTF